jgi:hypothetical protein
MHRCFLIPEMVLLICSHLKDLHFIRDLAALAQTCQTLHDPALDTLWYELFDLALLVKCMPTDLWKIDSEYSSLVRRKTSSGFIFSLTVVQSRSEGQLSQQTGQDSRYMHDACTHSS